MMIFVIITISVLVSTILFGLPCLFLAERKNRDGGAWAIWGLLFGLVTLIYILVLPSRHGDNISKIQRDNNFMRAMMVLFGYMAIIYLVIIISY